MKYAVKFKYGEDGLDNILFHIYIYVYFKQIYIKN